MPQIHAFYPAIASTTDKSFWLKLSRRDIAQIGEIFLKLPLENAELFRMISETIYIRFFATSDL
ncbi:MAG: hypothetical protein ACHBN1_18555 [Heteroscytonema crispum UTEX LB 1556]